MKPCLFRRGFFFNEDFNVSRTNFRYGRCCWWPDGCQRFWYCNWY
nr:MAG TPA: hypothetical protein [Caudoviricetes sp.]